jgi:hypothetical protein
MSTAFDFVIVPLPPAPSTRDEKASINAEAIGVAKAQTE